MSKILVLIDGTTLLYRSFFAIKGLSTNSGLPTNAIFGFVRSLRQMAQSWTPTHWVVIFDGGSPEWRLALHESYKAQRPPMPDDLRTQVKLAEEYLDSADVPHITQDRQEADDVMASMAVWALKDADRVLIATSDKDLYQMVNEKTSIVSVSGKPEAMGPAEIEEKTGVPPDRIAEWLALTGDNVDNIPGVPGVGPKTAAKLLKTYGSLEGILARIDDIPGGKLQDALRQCRETALKNLDLVRLRRDLPCPSSWDDLAIRAPDAARLLPFFEKLEFHSMARELRNRPGQDGELTLALS